MIDTHTIDITNAKKILSNCPHYDYIINYEFDYNDEITLSLIDWYKDLIFACNGDDDKEVKIISLIDKSMYLYAQDNKYRRGLKKIISVGEISINDNNHIKSLITKIIDFTNEYETLEILNISNSKWI